MRIYRAVFEEFGTRFGILSGIGAAEHGGRWNRRGQRTLYTATEIEAAVAERAFYSVLAPLDSVDLKRLVSGRASKATRESLKPKRFTLATIEFNAPGNLCSLTTQGKLDTELKKIGSSSFDLIEARKSPHANLPGQWTRSLGVSIESQIYKGLLAQSARSNQGFVAAIFNRNIRREDLDVISISDLTISLLDENGNLFGGHGLPDMRKVKFKVSSGSWQDCEVLNFSI